MKTILVTGGLGFIGSNTCVFLLQAGYNVVIVDNLYNSKYSVRTRIEAISKKKVKFYEIDILHEDQLNNVFQQNKIDAVIHFAGYKAVGESVQKPLLYYENNISGSLSLYRAMLKANCKYLVFSSSATVYGDPKQNPILENFPLKTTNPYGTSKLMNEMILSDICYADHDCSFMSLRYFHPIGAHRSGLLGESPNGVPNNLVPYIAQVAKGQREYVKVFGNDYDTIDGTGVRDYIHVCDLASGHLAALNYIFKHHGMEKINLGTGQGYSVLQVIKAYEKACHKTIPYQICARRKGDIAACYADISKAKRLLHWQAQYDLATMCKDSWHFIKDNDESWY